MRKDSASRGTTTMRDHCQDATTAPHQSTILQPLPSIRSQVHEIVHSMGRSLSWMRMNWYPANAPAQAITLILTLRTSIPLQARRRLCHRNSDAVQWYMNRGTYVP